jgi:hypothetical protein
MLAKPRRPREKRIVSPTRATYSIAEFCAISGLSRAAVLQSMDAGRLPNIRVGNRRLILAPLARASEAAAPLETENAGSQDRGDARQT